MNHYIVVDSPVGEVTIQTSDKGITGVWFENHTTKPQTLGMCSPTHPILVEAKRQFELYFSAKLTSFSLPIDAKGTEFQKRVWSELCQIPYGQSISYQELANRIGKPKAVRAVGAANGKNTISVIVPCHRVIGKNGKLTGYAGGVERKKRLLELEGIL